MRISVNPKLPVHFFNKPIEQRSKTELNRWWCNPFILGRKTGYDVYCLDGGAWDRPTFYAYAETFEEVVNCAKQLKETLSGTRLTVQMNIRAGRVVL